MKGYLDVFFFNSFNILTIFPQFSLLKLFLDNFSKLYNKAIKRFFALIILF